MRPVPSTLQGQYAGFMTRLAAFVVDAFVLISASVVAAFAIQTVLNVFRLGCVVTAPDSCPRDARPLWQGLINTLLFLRPIVTFGLGPALTVFYLVFSWTLTGRTMGKALMGIRIVPMNGQRMTVGRSLLRLVGYLLSLLPLFLGFVWILADDQRRGWHDRLAGTCVVYAWQARTNQEFLDKLAAGFGRNPPPTMPPRPTRRP